MPAKTKKPSKNWNQPGLRTSKNIFVQEHIWLVVAVVFLFGGSVGVGLQRYSGAADCVLNGINAVASCGDNPPLNNPALACQAASPKFDIPILIDTSGSMSGWVTIKARDAATSFIKTLDAKGMTFAVGQMEKPIFAEFTSDTAQALTDVQRIPSNATGSSYLGDVRPLLAKDPRSDVQNLIVVITDGNIDYHNSIQEVKASGNRVLAFAISIDRPGQYTGAHIQIAGNKVDTGSIWTSDIITTNFDNMGKDLLKAAQQLKVCPPGSGGGGGGSGDNGDGSGTGGSGSGSGRSGTGSGQRGSGSGGGGTSATRQGERPNPLPTPSPQGTKKQDPPKQEPSPFFDGKLYGIGSDPDAQSPVDLVRSPGKILKNVWFYVIVGTMLLAGGVGAGYWFWWRKRER